MDEEKKVEQNNVDFKMKENVANQLDSFTNPVKKPKNESVDAVSYYSGGDIKTEPMIKVSGLQNTEPDKQTRPIIRTYKSDVEETIQAGHVSSVNIALAENKRMLGKIRETGIGEKNNKLNKNIIIISIVLVIGGALIFFIPKLLVQSQYGTKPAPVQTVPSKPIMTVDVEEKVNVNDINLSRVSTTLKERVLQSNTSLGQIKNIYLTEATGTAEKLITSTEFLTLIKANEPSEISRTLSDQYMFGLHNYNGTQTFLILKILSYDNAYSGMLLWETNLWQDFKELFNLQSQNSNPNNPYAIEVAKFQDATFNNKDCRVVKDSSGNIIFLYSIIDNNTIVITTSVDTLKEIINRVSKARVVTQ